MNKSYKLVYSAGSVALLLMGAAQAAVTTANTFDKWSVSNGTINAACPTNFQCAAALSEPGFLSRMVTDGADGKQYFQTINTMQDATAATNALNTLAFSNESVVSFGNVRGILDKQRINQVEIVPIPGTSDRRELDFVNTAVIGSGWATDFVELTQSLKDVKSATSVGDGFQLDFIYKQVGLSDGVTQVPTGRAMKISTYVPLSVTPTDRQDFVMVESSGTLTQAGSATLAPNNLTWSNGDRVRALWLGQNIALAGQTFGTASYSRFVNTTTSNVAASINTFSFANPLGNAVTGIPDPSINWSTGIWGDLKTTGTIVSPFP